MRRHAWPLPTPLSHHVSHCHQSCRRHPAVLLSIQVVDDALPDHEISHAMSACDECRCR